MENSVRCGVENFGCNNFSDSGQSNGFQIPAAETYTRGTVATQNDRNTLCLSDHVTNSLVFEHYMGNTISTTYSVYNTSDVSPKTSCVKARRSSNPLDSGCHGNSNSSSVNNAFGSLRMLIPTVPRDRKLSKIETLRLAKSYIAHLHNTLSLGLSQEEQPCLARLKNCSSNDAEQRHTPAICTFCMGIRKQAPQHTRVVGHTRPLPARKRHHAVENNSITQ